MTMRFSQSRLIDQRRFGHRTRFLGQKAFRAYFDLTEYYWEFGRLFSEDSDLADICGLHVQAFRRIKEQLSRLFDIDDTGLWRDPDLERDRARAMQKSATNRANGRKGGQARWDNDDPESMGWASDAAAEASDDMANEMANAMPVAMGFAMETSAENGRVDMATGMASDMANASPVAMGSETAVSTVAGPAPRVDADPRDADLHARVFAACGDNVTAELRRSRDVEPIRALMRDGFDLDREILPLLRDRVKAFKTPLRTLRAWVRVELDKARAAGTMPKPLGEAAPPLVFIPVGTPDWDRWQAYGKASGKQPQGYPPIQEQGGKKGWRFASLTPPPLERAAAAAE